MSFRLPSVHQVSVATAALLATLSLSAPAQAEPIALVSGTVAADGTVTPNAAAITNPAGDAETRGIIELSLGVLQGYGELTALSFSIRPLFTADKTYTVTAYNGDGLLTSEDFSAEGMAVYSGNQLDSNTTIAIDLWPAVEDNVIDNVLGLRFAESESNGNVVTLEYLVFATFVSLGNVTTVSIGQIAQNVTNIFVYGPTTVSVATRAVPEPGTTLLLAASAAGAWLGRRRRR